MEYARFGVRAGFLRERMNETARESLLMRERENVSVLKYKTLVSASESSKPKQVKLILVDQRILQSQIYGQIEEICLGIVMHNN